MPSTIEKEVAPGVSVTAKYIDDYASPNAGIRGTYTVSVLFFEELRSEVVATGIESRDAARRKVEETARGLDLVGL